MPLSNTFPNSPVGKETRGIIINYGTKLHTASRRVMKDLIQNLCKNRFSSYIKVATCIPTMFFFFFFF